MASIAAKHSYRFGYLKSDHWQNLRLQKLAKEHGYCGLCRTDEWGNDVHHIFYRKSLYETQLCDLRVLCRRCHQLVHKIMEAYPQACPEMNHPRWRWRFIKSHARRVLIQIGEFRRRDKTALSDSHRVANRATAFREIVMGLFRKSRGRLYCGNEWNAIMKSEMPWHEGLIDFFKKTAPETDTDWLAQSQILDRWKNVWPQGEH